MTGAKVFGEHVDESFKAVAVVLDFVVEEIVERLVDGVALQRVGNVGIGFLVFVAQEHVSVVGLEIGGLRGCVV